MRKMLRTLATIVAFAPFSPGAVFAADLYAPRQEPAAIWHGFYVGGSVGGNWNTADVGGTSTMNLDGVVAGGHVGAQAEFDRVVVGVEGDFSGANATSALSGGAYSLTTKLDSLASVRGRLGFATGRTLIYGTGGAAFANGTVTLAAGSQSASATLSSTGYVAGGGLEMQLSQHFTARLEGLHYGFNSVSVAGYQTSVNLSSTVVRAGVSYYIQ